MSIWLILAVLAAVLQAVVFRAGLKQWQYLTKPAVMVFLFAWLVTATGPGGAALWFGAGMLLCLAGDILLIFEDRFFVFGLAAFLLGHVAYVVGFNIPLPEFDFFGLLLAVFIAILGGQVFRKIQAGLVEKKMLRLRRPVMAYTVVISMMLLSAMLTLFRTDWRPGAALLAAAGAGAFMVSDVILAFNKFVSPIRNGRMLNIGVYHLGQILLAAGVVSQFG
ncbi:MAG: lysoplasmalogenase [Chloroflexota bacterium]